MLVDPTSGRLTAVSQSAVLANETDEEVEQELFLQQIETSTPPCERADDLLAGAAGRPSSRRRGGGCCRGPGGGDADPGAARGHRGLHAQVALPAHPGGVRRDGPSGAGLRDAHARRRHLRGGGRPRGRRHPAVAAAARGAGGELSLLAGPRHRARQLALPGVEPVAHRRARRSRSATSRPTARCPSRCSAGAPGWTPGCSTSTSGSRRPTRPSRSGSPTSAPTSRTRRWSHCSPGRWSRRSPPGRSRRPGGPTCCGSPAGGRRGTGSPATSCTRWTAPPRHHARSSGPSWSSAATPWTSTVTSKLVTEGFERMVARGNGATRQRRVFESTGSLPAVVEDLARRTEESWG